MAAQSLVLRDPNPNHNSADDPGSTAMTTSHGEGNNNHEQRNKVMQKAAPRISYSDGQYDYIVLDDDDDDVNDEEIIEEEIIEEEIIDDGEEDISSSSSSYSEPCPFDEREETKERIMKAYDNIEEAEEDEAESIEESQSLYWAMQGALDTYLTADLDLLYSFPPWSIQSTTKATTGKIHESWKSWDITKSDDGATKSRQDIGTDVVKSDPPLLMENLEKHNSYSKKVEDLAPIPEHPVFTTGVDIHDEESKKGQLAKHNTSILASSENTATNSADTDKRAVDQRGTQSSIFRKSRQRPRDTQKAAREEKQQKQKQKHQRQLQQQETGDIESQQQQQHQHHQQQQQQHRFRNPRLDQFFDEAIDLVNPAAASLAQGGDAGRKQHSGEESVLDSETDADRRVAGAVVLGILLLLPLLAMGIVLVVRNEQSDSAPNNGKDGNMVEVIPMMPNNATTNNIFVEENSTSSFNMLPP